MLRRRSDRDGGLLSSRDLSCSSTDPFVSSATGDYRLKTSSWPINAGKALASDGFINKDANGIVRGADGSWDMGALEFQ